MSGPLPQPQQPNAPPSSSFTSPATASAEPAPLIDGEPSPPGRFGNGTAELRRTPYADTARQDNSGTPTTPGLPLTKNAAPPLLFIAAPATRRRGAGPSRSRWSELAKGDSPVNALLFRPPCPTYALSGPLAAICQRRILMLLPLHAAAGGAPLPCVFLHHPRGRYLLVHFHGNACDVGESSVYAYHDLGLSMLIPEYPGYGLAAGSPTEGGVLAMAEAVVRFAIDVMRVPPSRIILQGQSVGSGPAAHCARMLCDEGRPPAGMVLKSPFVSVKELVAPLAHSQLPAHKRCAARLLLRWVADRFPNMENVARTPCPLLVLHGRQDEIVPVWHGESIHAASPSSNKQLVTPESGDHSTGIACYDEVAAFIASLGEPPPLAIDPPPPEWTDYAAGGKELSAAAARRRRTWLLRCTVGALWCLWCATAAGLWHDRRSTTAFLVCHAVGGLISAPLGPMRQSIVYSAAPRRPYVYYAWRAALAVFALARAVWGAAEVGLGGSDFPEGLLATAAVAAALDWLRVLRVLCFNR
eukprot:TRINITY_DN33668_c0_g1_i1.p1 TRINITY_DN33668_c0_g1~~TRINITY_DN33668_c0_g1_i1.p1  ORF type:complete len:527 (+),score=142.12 TRINITY_DN33668_c0_g1_i1:125-1705(+)